MVGLAGAGGVAGVGRGADEVVLVAAGGAGRLEAVDRARTGAVAVLDHVALARVRAADRGVGLEVVEAAAGGVAGVGVVARGLGRVTAHGAGREELIVVAHAGLTDVLPDALRAEAVAEGAVDRVVGLAHARPIAGVGVGAVVVQVVATGVAGGTVGPHGVAVRQGRAALAIVLRVEHRVVEARAADEAGARVDRVRARARAVAHVVRAVQPVAGAGRVDRERGPARVVHRRLARLTVVVGLQHALRPARATDEAVARVDGVRAGTGAIALVGGAVLAVGVAGRVGRLVGVGTPHADQALIHGALIAVAAQAAVGRAVAGAGTVADVGLGAGEAVDTGGVDLAVALHAVVLGLVAHHLGAHVRVVHAAVAVAAALAVATRVARVVHGAEKAVVAQTALHDLQHAARDRVAVQRLRVARVVDADVAVVAGVVVRLVQDLGGVLSQRVAGVHGAGEAVVDLGEQRGVVFVDAAFAVVVPAVAELRVAREDAIFVHVAVVVRRAAHAVGTAAGDRVFVGIRLEEVEITVAVVVHAVALVLRERRRPIGVVVALVQVLGRELVAAGTRRGVVVAVHGVKAAEALHHHRDARAADLLVAGVVRRGRLARARRQAEAGDERDDADELAHADPSRPPIRRARIGVVDESTVEAAGLAIERIAHVSGLPCRLMSEHYARYAVFRREEGPLALASGKTLN